MLIFWCLVNFFFKIDIVGKRFILFVLERILVCSEFRVFDICNFEIIYCIEVELN